MEQAAVIRAAAAVVVRAMARKDVAAALMALAMLRAATVVVARALRSQAPLID